MKKKSLQKSENFMESVPWRLPPEWKMKCMNCGKPITVRHCWLWHGIAHKTQKFVAYHGNGFHRCVPDTRTLSFLNSVARPDCVLVWGEEKISAKK